jgi:uncharacterized protein
MFDVSLRVFANPLLGGALIGLAASMLLFFNGHIAGVSGILNHVFQTRWRMAFILGLVAGGAGYFYLGGPAGRSSFSVDADVGIGIVQTMIAGLLVGFGTVYGSGCTSGHGVCGVSRLSLRSIVATLLFILSGFVTVTFMMRFFR